MCEVGPWGQDIVNGEEWGTGASGRQHAVMV